MAWVAVAALFHKTTLILTPMAIFAGRKNLVALAGVLVTVELMFRNRIDLTESQITFWSWMSLGGLAFIGLLAVSPSSTAVDRVALNWIPLQLNVWSRWPAAMARNHNAQLPWVVGVLLYSLAVQFVWLFYADHSYLWVQYKLHPWVWLWQ